jgi:hypothetical protein
MFYCMAINFEVQTFSYCSLHVNDKIVLNTSLYESLRHVLSLNGFSSPLNGLIQKEDALFNLL